MRTYYGHAATEERPATVFARDDRGPKPLAHHLRHSPTGFNWGYGGSGPAELARCILLDAFGVRECPAADGDECQCASSWVEPSYQAFKSDTIAKLVQDEDWKLLQQDVIDWDFDYLRQDKEQEEPPRPVTAKA